MTVYDVRIGDVSQQVVARTPSEAATEAVRNIGTRAFVLTKSGPDGDRYDVRAEVAGHGEFGLAVLTPPGVALDLTGWVRS